MTGDGRRNGAGGSAGRRASRHSAGVVLFRRVGAGIELLLVRPGGPYLHARDIGAWQIPKGQIEPGENAEAAATRETEEELGIRLAGRPVPLATIRQAGGKRVDAFVLEQDLDPAAIVSNLFDLEWPPHGGRIRQFPEVAEARWFDPAAAAERMLPSQRPLLDAVMAYARGIVGEGAPPA